MGVTGLWSWLINIRGFTRSDECLNDGESLGPRILLADGNALISYLYKESRCKGNLVHFSSFVRAFVHVFKAAGLILQVIFDGMYEYIKDNERHQRRDATVTRLLDLWKQQRLDGCNNNHNLYNVQLDEKKILDFTLPTKRQLPPFSESKQTQNIMNQVDIMPLWGKWHFIQILEHLEVEVRFSVGENDQDIVQTFINSTRQSPSNSSLTPQIIGILSQDSDFLIFPKCVYFPLNDLFIQSGKIYVRRYTSEAVAKNLGLTEEGLVLFACLAGNDFTSSGELGQVQKRQKGSQRLRISPPHKSVIFPLLLKFLKSTLYNGEIGVLEGLREMIASFTTCHCCEHLQVSMTPRKSPVSWSEHTICTCTCTCIYTSTNILIDQPNNEPADNSDDMLSSPVPQSKKIKTEPEIDINNPNPQKDPNIFNEVKHKNITNNNLNNDNRSNTLSIIPNSSKNKHRSKRKKQRSRRLNNSNKNPDNNCNNLNNKLEERISSVELNELIKIIFGCTHPNDPCASPSNNIFLSRFSAAVKKYHPVVHHVQFNHSNDSINLNHVSRSPTPLIVLECRYPANEPVVQQHATIPKFDDSIDTAEDDSKNDTKPKVFLQTVYCISPALRLAFDRNKVNPALLGLWLDRTHWLHTNIEVCLYPLHQLLAPLRSRFYALFAPIPTHPDNPKNTYVTEHGLYLSKQDSSNKFSKNVAEYNEGLSLTILSQDLKTHRQVIFQTCDVVVNFTFLNGLNLYTTEDHIDEKQVKPFIPSSHSSEHRNCLFQHMYDRDKSIFQVQVFLMVFGFSSSFPGINLNNNGNNVQIIQEYIDKINTFPVGEQMFAIVLLGAAKILKRRFSLLHDRGVFLFSLMVLFSHHLNLNTQLDQGIKPPSDNSGFTNNTSNLSNDNICNEHKTGTEMTIGLFSLLFHYALLLNQTCSLPFQEPFLINMLNGAQFWREWNYLNHHAQSRPSDNRPSPVSLSNLMQNFNAKSITISSKITSLQSMFNHMHMMNTGQVKIHSESSIVIPDWANSLLELVIRELI